MEDNKAPSNILQFPPRKKDGETAPAPNPSASVAEPKPKKKRAPKKNVGATVVAIILFTAAVNRYVFDRTSGAADLASTTNVGRTIASVERVNWKRDAAWEKQLAESLASAKVRDVASTQVGRPATMEEKLRWGTLEEKYTITFRPDVHEIDSIAFQDPGGTPSYILNRSEFLNEYAKLFNAASSKLKSVEESSDKTIESYTLFDKDDRAKGEARFELDRHKRLLSLKVEPAQI